jgi:hypothetical protein
MKLRFVPALALASLLFGVHARAQNHTQAQVEPDAPSQLHIGLYLNPIGTRISNSTADTGTFAYLGTGEKSQYFYGISLGGYVDPFHPGKVDVGIDVRDTIQHGNNASLNSFLVGVRVTGKPFAMPLRPYLQGSIGAGTSRPPTSIIHVTKAEYVGLAGLDYTVGRHVDIRVLELSYGSLITAGSGTIGGSAVIPASTLFGFSSGLVFRIR